MVEEFVGEITGVPERGHESGVESSGAGATSRKGYRSSQVLDAELPFGMGPSGTLSFWFRADRDYRPGPGERREKIPLVRIGETVAVSFFYQGNAVNLFVEWNDSVDTAIDRHIRVLMPEFPGGEWHHFAVHWDDETGLLNAFLDGSPFYWETQRVSPWSNPIGRMIEVDATRFDLADVRVDSRPLSAAAIRERVGAENLGRLDHLIGAGELGTVAVDEWKGELLYSSDLDSTESVDGWRLEGPGIVEFEDGWMRMRSERPEGPQGHIVHWIPEDFPDRFVAEWDFQLLSEDGLCIVFFGAKGRNGEDLFDPSLADREGQFFQYVKGDIDNYHISYFADTPLNPRKTTNLRKNHGLYLVASGPVGVPPNSDKVHRVSLIKDGGHIRLAVDGELIVDYEDDGERFGPVLREGKIGLRQMQWTDGRYRNLRVYELADESRVAEVKLGGRNGRGVRAAQYFDAEAGKSLRRAPIDQTPHGENARRYSYSLVGFAYRVFREGNDDAVANAALRELADYYLNNPQKLVDIDSFHWIADSLGRVWQDYGSKGKRRANAIDPATAERLLEMMWAYASKQSRLEEWSRLAEDPWIILYSENHHHMKTLAAYIITGVLKESPKYADRAFEDGGRAAEHHDAVSAYFEDFLRERGMRGFLVEIANKGYGWPTMSTWLYLHDHADDPELRRLGGLLTDLYWALWAQEQFDGVRGGAKTRFYQETWDRLTSVDWVRWASWFFFETGAQPDFHAPLTGAAVTAYSPPEVVASMVKEATESGPYAIEQGRFGLALDRKFFPPEYRVANAAPALRRYTWVTPDFIMGSFQHAPLPFDDWVMISSQNRWMGVNFKGNDLARIFPQAKPTDGGRVTYNQHWAVQAHGSLIAQRLPPRLREDAPEVDPESFKYEVNAEKLSKLTGDYRVWISVAGLTGRLHEDGWLFVRAPSAYAAVRPANGDYRFEKARGPGDGYWLIPDNPDSPVIIEVASQDDFVNYERFRDAVKSLPIAWSEQKLEYRGLSGAKLTFYADRSGLPEIDGTPVEVADTPFLSGPFVRETNSRGLVSIEFEGLSAQLNFNRNPSSNPEEK